MPMPPTGAANDSYTVSREITVGEPVKNSEGKSTAHRIKFEVTGMIWTKDDTTETISGSDVDNYLYVTNGSLRWKTDAMPH